MNILKAGRSGIVYTVIGIVCTLAVGTLLGRILRVSDRTAFLISTGTAICGGSAIAAMGPVVHAKDEEMSVSIGTVFLLNAVGLPEWIAHSPAEYEVLALKLARDRAAHAAVKAKLARHRGTYPLFDTARFTRNLEAAYLTMWERHQRGEPPASFAVGETVAP